MLYCYIYIIVFFFKFRYEKTFIWVVYKNILFFCFLNIFVYQLILPYIIITYLYTNAQLFYNQYQSMTCSFHYIKIVSFG
jgi:hypothetical protein